MRKTLFKRLIPSVSALALSVGLLGSIPASADDSNIEYKYTLFAYSSEEGAISSSAANFCVNGNIATNGTISAGQNCNVNGTKKEHANEAMPEISKSINEKFFAENVDVKAENYSKNETNIEVKAPTDVKGKAELNGNIQLSAGLKAMGDIALSGNVLNKNSTVLFSENGNIVIDTENANLTGLVYAPKGNIIIESKNLNLNSVVMIANKITLNSPNVNANCNTAMAKFVQESIEKNGNNGSDDENEEEPEPVTDPAIYAYGEYNEETKSVDIEWYSNVTGEFAVLESLNGKDYSLLSKVTNDTKYSFKVTSDFIKKYFKVAIIKDGKAIESIPFSIVNTNGKYSTELLDTDKDGLADLYEEMLGTDKTKPDTDNDDLTDYEEAYITNTDPTKYDSVTEGVSDADADNDKDGLTNKREIELKTDPNSDDTDGDNLKDGDELSKYNTDPTKRDTDGDELEDDDELRFNYDPNKQDTDGNGIIDGKEKNQQTIDVVPDNKEQAVTKVSVSMSASGNIEKTTTVESIMNKDVLCSNVVGLVGEPFSIESESSFDKATITFTVDKTKLGETEFDNLMFLWYDRENDNFVELETSHDAANSTVSIETTHFSEYMIVDSKKWFENWREIESDWKKHIQSTSSTVHVVEPTATVLYIKCYPSSDPDFFEPVSDSTSTTMYTKTNYRTLVSDHLISSMSAVDTMKLAYTEERNGSTLYGTLKGRFGEDGWEESAAAGDFCGDKSILRQRLDLFLNTATRTNLFRDICWAATDLIKQPKKDRRIVYITDHSGSLDYSIFENRTPQSNAFWKNAYYSVPVYFVCVGNFDRTNLEIIASETGGKVYDVATLNELYSKLGENNNVSNVQDYDKDGFSDMEETYGLLVESSGKRYYTDPQKKDTDDDGLDDNYEIPKDSLCEEGTDCFGNKYTKRYYSILSNPTVKDTDDDGYYDTCDPDRMNKPEFLGDKYDFLDNEIYFIRDINDKYLDVKNASTSAGSIPIMYDKNGDDNQKFRFEWCGNGYQIHPMNNEKLSLTLSSDSSGNNKVSFEPKSNSENQIWEVLMYTKPEDNVNDSGIVIRSKILSADGNKPLYLHCQGEEVTTSSDRDISSAFKLVEISDWVRFGQLYIYYMGLVANPNSDVIRALENYQNNKNHDFKDHAVDEDKKDVTNKIPYKNSYLLHRQGLTDFPEMKFGDEQMNENVCEVIATYNALTISGETLDFFKLVAEFENNALLVWNSGWWGSDPSRIEDCLISYNKGYVRIGMSFFIFLCCERNDQISFSNMMCDKLKKASEIGKAAIISVKFDTVNKHTYTVEYNDSSESIMCAYNMDDYSDKIPTNVVSKILKNEHYVFNMYVIL